ncbi:MAG: HNH endonuclease [Flavobacterium sp.]|uniref:HNH endonuclease n=1 Tax=Flavobacterium sp. TaxID=239 RepID=UPI003BE3674D
MSNRWGIPKEVEMIVLQRDLSCVYCGISFTDKDGNRRTRRTWEHIINDIRINGIENIAVCCGSCNASKGNKKLEDWLKSKYCETKRITKESISDVVKKHLAETTTA